MTNLLSPVAKAKFFDNNGRPAVGYKVFTYSAGTDTKLDTYPDSDTGTPNPNPIVLDFRGEANIWMPPNVAYKLVFCPPNDTDPPTAPIWSVDNIVQSQLLTLYGGVDTGVANAYVIDFDSNFTAYQDGILIYFVAANQNTGASTINVNGLGPVSILTPTGGALPAGVIASNQMTGIIYRGGSFYLITVTLLAGTFVGRLTGMTTTVTGNISYRVAGGIVTLTAGGNINGTSNATGMTIEDIPAFLAPAQFQIVICASLRDNGTGNFAGSCGIGFGAISVTRLVVSGSNVLFNGGFTSSGIKGIDGSWSISYQL